MLLGLADTGSSLHGYTVPWLTVPLKWYYCSGIIVIRDSSRRKTRPLMIESLPPHSLWCDSAARPADTHPLLAGQSHAPQQGSQAGQLGASWSQDRGRNRSRLEASSPHSCFLGDGDRQPVHDLNCVSPTPAMACTLEQGRLGSVFPASVTWGSPL